MKLCTKRVERLLAAKSADDVAALLREAGVKGKPQSFGSCPVACFIRAGGSSWAVVGRGEMQWPEGSRLLGVAMPDHVRAFIQAFDKGAYPELAV